MAVCMLFAIQTSWSGEIDCRAFYATDNQSNIVKVIKGIKHLYEHPEIQVHIGTNQFLQGFHMDDFEQRVINEKAYKVLLETFGTPGSDAVCFGTGYQVFDDILYLMRGE